MVGWGLEFDFGQVFGYSQLVVAGRFLSSVAETGAVLPSGFWMAFLGSSVLVLVERRHISLIALG
jgi:hypothetical protein